MALNLDELADRFDALHATDPELRIDVHGRGKNATATVAAGGGHPKTTGDFEGFIEDAADRLDPTGPGSPVDRVVRVIQDRAPRLIVPDQIGATIRGAAGAVAIALRRPPPGLTADQAAALAGRGFVSDAPSARAGLADAARRVHDLPTLIAWAVRAVEYGDTVRLLHERTAEAARVEGGPAPDALPDTPGLDMDGAAWTWLRDELRSLTLGLTDDHLRTLSASAVVDLKRSNRADLADLADDARARLDRAPGGTFDRLQAELCDRFPEVTADLPRAESSDARLTWRKGVWYGDCTGGLLDSDRLGRARRDKRIKPHEARLISGRWQYAVEAVSREFPEYADKFTATEPDET